MTATLLSGVRSWLPDVWQPTTGNLGIRYPFQDGPLEPPTLEMAEVGNQAWVDQESQLVLAGPRQSRSTDPHHHQPADPCPTIEDHSVADRHDLDRAPA
jgi:hypothetical protein